MIFIAASKKTILFSLILLGFSAFSQIKGVVTDELHKPIPYVNIWVENEYIGTTSEENGTFSLHVKTEKKIVFSALGYETKIIPSKDIKTVILYPKTLELNEVVIEKRKGTSEIIIGDFSGIKLNSGVTNVGQENAHVWGKFIASNEKIESHPFVKSIEFVTSSKLKNVLLRIRVFNVGKDSIPKEDAVEEDILVPIKKGRNNNIVNLSKYNIKIPKEGIVFGFEYLKLEQNLHRYIVDGQIEYSYEPSIIGFAFGGETLLLLNRNGTLRSSGFGNVEIALKIKLSN